MSKPHPKAKLYSALLNKMTAANAAGYYLEASWLQYAIFEDRLIAILLSTGGAHRKGSTKQIRNFGEKLIWVKKRRRRDQLLGFNFSKAWLDQLNKWRERRNRLMHAMANATVSIARIETRAKRLAMLGEPLVFQACRQTSRLRTHRHQVAIPKKPYPYNK